jgi:hypothetical protein
LYYFLSKTKQSNYQIKISQLVDQEIIKSNFLNNEDILNNNAVIDLEKRHTLSFDLDRFKLLGDLCFLSIGMVLNADEKKLKVYLLKMI